MYAVSENTAVIHTVDFFTPVVDDPYDYGAIAAANAMSDVYAMGGEVHMALNICGFPATLGVETVSEIFRGGADKVTEAGGVLLGGHTVDDAEPKYGLAVIGFVHPDKIVTKKGAEIGDRLYLTKPLGTGCITTSLKNGTAEPRHVKTAVESMKALSRDAGKAMQAADITTATDITGFSLIGHAADVAAKSGVCLQIHANEIPFLDGGERYAEMGMFPGGTERNRKYYSDRVDIMRALPEHLLRLLYTPETSGGLLIAAGDGKEKRLLDAGAKLGVSMAKIGIVTAGEGIRIA